MSLGAAPLHLCLKLGTGTGFANAPSIFIIIFFDEFSQPERNKKAAERINGFRMAILFMGFKFYGFCETIFSSRFLSFAIDISWQSGLTSSTLNGFFMLKALLVKPYFKSTVINLCGTAHQVAAYICSTLQMAAHF